MSKPSAIGHQPSAVSGQSSTNSTFDIRHSTFDIPHSVDSLVRNFWGIDGIDAFRPLQLEAINADLGFRDSLVVMPTGGGKSLCYQLPATARHFELVPRRGMTLVVSPLIALMTDQVMSLERRGIPADCLHSQKHPWQQVEIAKQAKAGRLALLYVSPERFTSPEFITMLTECRVDSVVIDEAHCISQWGHDFRPAYRKLGDYRKVLTGVPFHAFTATATPQVRKEIVKQLKLDGRDGPVVLVGDFDRPNLFLSVQRRRHVDAQLLEFIRARPDKAGIIYCITRTETEWIALMLRQSGIPAMYYHGELDDDERRRVQDWFMESRQPSAISPQPIPHSAFDIQHSTKVVVATIAFGMGIDKPDVRWVVHAAMPSSLEVYHQEIGRAGRDGHPAECVILHWPDDFGTWEERLVGDETLSDIHHGEKLSQASAMDEFCTTDYCRHDELAAHFGQAGDPNAKCANCDNCTKEGVKG